MYEILSDIGDALMQLADPGLCFLPVIREFLLASQPTLELRQLPGVLLQWKETVALVSAASAGQEREDAPI